MNQVRKVIALAMLAVVAVGCLNKKKSENAESETLWAPTAGASVGANVSVDAVALKRYLDERARNSENVVGLIQALLEGTKHKLNTEAQKKKIAAYNVVVCKMENRCDVTVDQKGHYYFVTHTDAAGASYGIWAFRAGNLVNNGSGGDDNWQFWGVHNHKRGQGAVPVRFETHYNYGP